MSRSTLTSGSSNDASVDKGVEFACTYSSLLHQTEMLSNEIRMKAYHNAIFKNKRHFRGKVVLDVGTGSGILAIWAAKAGAQKVYAVEATKIADHARELVKANKLEHVVEVIKGSIEKILLPRKVDVIISEWMGNFLLHESMIDSVIYARDHWLKENGVMYPSHARMWVAPIRSISKDKEKDTFEKQMGFWSGLVDKTNRLYGVKMHALAKPFEEEQRNYYMQKSALTNVHPDQVIGTHAMMPEINCSTVTVSDTAKMSSRVSSLITVDMTELYGYVGWFDVDFRGNLQNHAKKEIELSTAPREGISTHLGQQVFPLVTKSPGLRKGDCLKFDISMKHSSDYHGLMQVCFRCRIERSFSKTY